MDDHKADIWNEELNNRFTYHKPKQGQPEKYETIRRLGKEYAEFITEICPDCRELSIAVTKIEEAVFWANASVARNEQS